MVRRTSLTLTAHTLLLFLILLFHFELLYFSLGHFSACLLQDLVENKIPFLPSLLHALCLVNHLVAQYCALVIDHVVYYQLEDALERLAVELVVSAICYFS